MSNNPSQLETEFQEELLDAYAEANTKYRYNPTGFIQMVNEHGGVDTARILLGTGSAVQTGLVELWKCQRLDLSVEAKVLIPKYARLFTSGLKDTARSRLSDHGFDVDAWLSTLQ
jgi:hypothetical protein